MIRKVIVPKVDANMEEATIGRWLKAEGDTIKKKEPLVEIITDKAVFELESPASGRLRKIVASEKSVVPPQYVIAFVGDADAPLPDVDAFNRRLIEQSHPASPHDSARPGEPSHASGAGDGPRRRATPAARRIARENNLDLSQLRNGTRSDLITEEMVRQHLARRGK